MKTLSKVLFLSLTITGLSYAMDNKIENKVQEKEDLFFQSNIAKLKKPIADFVEDFKTWPKEEQDKIKIFDYGYVIQGKLAVADKYNGSIGFYLDCRLDNKQIGPFLSLIDYLKKQKQAQ